ncbi:EF-hand domain-containing protein [Acinetobacter stercoris]|uniref:EF hand n=1 Tax=Acinetobacter stercoris TaxID=2126983 RepID=A0A2U3N2D9_9GAMM|nr:hypothetical protein [Acinetobacter stercoris]SPL71775.1 EF hand [Acinetobacter stercoris]
MLKTFLFVLCSLPTISFSCEPASIDWQTFYLKYDLDKDQFIHSHEFKYVTDFAPYAWPHMKEFKNQSGNLKLFNELDKNHDQKLSREELWNIYIILKNPCDDWRY